VIPNVSQDAFNSGGRWGKGLMTIRDSGGHWLPPAFIQIKGGNFGLQAGSDSTDLVMIFTDEGAIESLLKGKLTLNANSDGVLVGTSQGGGAVIEVDDQSDARVYGQGISGEDILLSRSVKSNAAVAPFLRAMELSPRVSTNQPEIQN
jgi:lipid-binding SYLF domain-containing protein